MPRSHREPSFAVCVCVCVCVCMCVCVYTHTHTHTCMYLYNLVISRMKKSTLAARFITFSQVTKCAVVTRRALVTKRSAKHHALVFVPTSQCGQVSLIRSKPINTKAKANRNNTFFCPFALPHVLNSVENPFYCFLQQSSRRGPERISAIN